LINLIGINEINEKFWIEALCGIVTSF